VSQLVGLPQPHAWLETALSQPAGLAAAAWQPQPSEGTSLARLAPAPVRPSLAIAQPAEQLQPPEAPPAALAQAAEQLQMPEGPPPASAQPAGQLQTPERPALALAQPAGQPRPSDGQPPALSQPVGQLQPPEVPPLALAQPAGQPQPPEAQDTLSAPGNHLLHHCATLKPCTEVPLHKDVCVSLSLTATLALAIAGNIHEHMLVVMAGLVDVLCVADARP